MMATPIVAPQRSLRPKEHGAYGELAFPLVTALLLGKPSLVSLSLAAAAIAAFVAHEPLLVLLGHRGARARSEEQARARRALVILGGATIATGLLGVVLGSGEVRLALVLPVLLVATLMPLVRARRERTALGEVLAASALAAAAVPVAVAGGVAMPRALLLWAVWTTAFSLATFEVRTVIARARKDAAAPSSIVPAVTAVLLVASVGLALAHQVPLAAPIGLAPHALFVLGLRLSPPAPKQLRVVGWMLIATSALTTVLLAIVGAA